MFRRSLLAMPLAGAARAQWAPSRPIRLIIAFPPGGSTDVLGRLIAPLLAARLRQPVVPENRSGAAGAVGSGFVASAPADGHTILLDSGGQAVNPYLMRGLGFDYVTGFAPITLLATLPLVLVVLAESGITTLAELLARARAEPAAYGSVGVGSRTHLAGALLLRRAGIAGTHVPYRGGADQITAQLRGETLFGFSSVALTAALLREGRLRALGVKVAVITGRDTLPRAVMQAAQPDAVTSSGPVCAALSALPAPPRDRLPFHSRGRPPQRRAPHPSPPPPPG
jgi:tripartite-type tricarboxylate transporter receptor subunit TctC